MKNSKKLRKLDLLTFEINLLVEVMIDALKQHEDKKGIYPISYLSGMIKDKLGKARNLF